MAKQAARRTMTIEVHLTVLAIDSHYEPVTRAAFEFRERHVYPVLESRGFAVEKLQGPLARRIHTARKAARSNVTYVTGVGHGDYGRYTGHYYDAVLDVGHYAREEVQGKIIHFLSCRTARDLGPDVVRQGCRAYFGYDEDFVFLMEDADLFFECDAEIDRGFADGLSAADVYCRVRERFESTIARLRAAGKQYQAAILEMDLDRLRCPSSGGTEWGDPAARL